MSANAGAEPATPLKSRDNGAAVAATSEINNLVRRLRDESGLSITLRGLTFSPAQQENTPGNLLHNRIAFLYYKDKEGLITAINTFESDLVDHLSCLSSQRRTDLLLNRLNDLTWFSRERLPAARQYPSVPSTPTPSFRKLCKTPISRADSKAELDYDSEPSSPLAGKSRIAARGSVGISRTTTMTTDNSFDSGATTLPEDITPSTSFSSSAVDLTREGIKSSGTNEFGGVNSSCLSQAYNQYEELQHMPNIKRGITPEAFEESELPPAKRRKSDELKETTRLSNFDYELHTELSNVPDSEGKRKTELLHHQVNKWIQSGAFPDLPYAFDKDKPYSVSVERARLVEDARLTHKQAASVSSHRGAKDLLAAQTATSFQHASPAIWDLPVATTRSTSEDPKLVLNGRVSLNPKNDQAPLFRLSMQPVRKEAKSTLIERHFGWDRVLTLTCPSLTKDLSLTSFRPGVGDQVRF